MINRYNLPLLKSLGFFVDNPYEEIHLREFSRRLNISVNTAQRFLGVFLEENLIKDERKANLRYFKANLDSIVFRNIKITFSLRDLEKTEIINSLKKEVSHLVLFGSVAEGRDDINSDIDLIVVSSNKKKISKLIDNSQKKLNRELNVHIFSWVEWKKKFRENKAFYREVIIRGINLIGDLPIIE